MILHWNQVWGMGFHYGIQDVGFEAGWNTFVQDWLDGNVENGKYMDHVAGWYQRHKNDPTNIVLIVRYEDLKHDSNSTIRQIADHIGVPVDVKVLVKGKEAISFEKMKKADENNFGLKFMRWLGVLRKKHIREGKVDGRAGLQLLPSHRAALEQEYEDKLAKLGVPREWILLD